MFVHTLTLFLAFGAVIGGAIPEIHVNETEKLTNTTTAPITSTEKPVNSTSAPNTTAKPVNATSAPVTSTEKPVNSTSAPSTTAKPENATSAPISSTEKPVNSTSAPSTTAKPVNTTSAPESSTAKPANVTSAPNTTSAAVSTTVKPSKAPPASTTAKPKNVTITTLTSEAGRAGSFAHFEGVDPNTLSCDAKGQVFLLLPTFNDCSKFYMCVHGEEVEFHCPPTTMFDFVIQTCNHPWAFECILRTPKEDSESEGSGYGRDVDNYGTFGEEFENGLMDFLTAESTGTVRPVAGNAGKLYKGPLNCQRADSASRQVAYKDDCQRYWRCVGAVPQIQTCPDGLLYNELTQQCDFEANVKCLVQTDEELHGEFIIYK